MVSVGEGEVTNAFSVTDRASSAIPTGDQDITVVATTNAPLMNQMVGANSPLLGTNTLPLGTNTVWGPNGVLTIGQTNQWHFYRRHQHRADAGLYQRGVHHFRGQHALDPAHGRL